MSIYLFTNQSPGAPEFKQGSGTMINVLDYCLVTGMGWTKTFSGTNTATYRAPTGNRFYLGIDDTSTTNFRLRGFEVATSAGTAITSGINPFPNDSQVSGGLYIVKRQAMSTPWFLISDGLIFYFCCNYTAGTPEHNDGMCFGDFIPYATYDTFNTVIKGSYDTGNSGFQNTSKLRNVVNTTYIARSATQLGGSTYANFIIDVSRSKSDFRIGGSGTPFPHPITNTLDLGIVEIGDSIGIRGRLPGIWCPFHTYGSFANGDTYTSNTLNRSFIARKFGYSSETSTIFFETTDNWRS